MRFVLDLQQQAPCVEFHINETTYLMFYSPRKWYDAVLTCIQHNGCLVKVTPNNIHDITYIMGENRTGNPQN